MGKTRIRKIKTNSSEQKLQYNDSPDMFYMSLEEAKEAIANQYEFLAERYEYKYPKHKGLT